MSQKLVASVLLIAIIVVVGILFYWIAGRFIGTENVTHQNALMAEQTGYKEIMNKPAVPPAVPKDTPQSEKPATEAPVPQAYSQYCLLGTAIPPRGMSSAVIRNNDTGVQHLYHPGDSLDAAVVETIEPDRVICRLNNSCFSLSLSVHRQENATDEPPLYSNLPPRDFSKPDPDRMTAGWEEVRNLMIQIQLNANTESGEPKGVIVGDIQKDSVFERAGLKTGDIIHTINGREIVIEDDAMEIYEVFRSGDPVEIHIIRKGESLTLESTP